MSKDITTRSSRYSIGGSTKGLLTLRTGGSSSRRPIRAGFWTLWPVIRCLKRRNGSIVKNPRALLTLAVLPDRYAICRLDSKTDIPEWANKGHFVSIARTPEEVSIVCLEANVPSGVEYEPAWRILRCEGPLDLSLPGIMASLAEPLADAGVPIFPIATHHTDYILVKEQHLETAINALTAYGHAVRA